MKVELISGKQKREFSLEHAEAILRHPSNKKGGWHLPKDSKFEFVKNELRVKSNKREDSKSKVQAGDK